MSSSSSKNPQKRDKKVLFSDKKDKEKFKKKSSKDKSHRPGASKSVHSSRARNKNWFRLKVSAKFADDGDRVHRRASTSTTSSAVDDAVPTPVLDAATRHLDVASSAETAVERSVNVTLRRHREHRAIDESSVDLSWIQGEARQQPDAYRQVLKVVRLSHAGISSPRRRDSEELYSYATLAFGYDRNEQALSLQAVQEEIERERDTPSLAPEERTRCEYTLAKSIVRSVLWYDALRVYIDAKAGKAKSSASAKLEVPVEKLSSSARWIIDNAVPGAYARRLALLECSVGFWRHSVHATRAILAHLQVLRQWHGASLKQAADSLPNDWSSYCRGEQCRCALATLLGQCKLYVTRVWRSFPSNTPKGAFRSLLEVCLAGDQLMSMLDIEYAEQSPLDDATLVSWFAEAASDEYRAIVEQAERSIDDEHSDAIRCRRLEVLAVVASLVEQRTLETLEYSRDVKAFFPKHERTLTQQCARVLFEALLGDVEHFSSRTPPHEVGGEVLALASKLWTCVPTLCDEAGKREALDAVRMHSALGPLMVAWAADTVRKLETWTSNAVRADCWQMSAGSDRISTSIVDAYTCMEQTVNFVARRHYVRVCIDADPKNQQREFARLAIRQTTNAYLRCLRRVHEQSCVTQLANHPQRRTLSKVTFDDDIKYFSMHRYSSIFRLPFSIDVPQCSYVRINDMQKTRIMLEEFREQMHMRSNELDDAFRSTKACMERCISMILYQYMAYVQPTLVILLNIDEEVYRNILPEMKDGDDESTNVVESNDDTTIESLTERYIYRNYLDRQVDRGYNSLETICFRALLISLWRHCCALVSRAVLVQSIGKQRGTSIFGFRVHEDDCTLRAEKSARRASRARELILSLRDYLHSDGKGLREKYMKDDREYVLLTRTLDLFDKSNDDLLRLYVTYSSSFGENDENSKHYARAIEYILDTRMSAETRRSLLHTIG